MDFKLSELLEGILGCILGLVLGCAQIGLLIWLFTHHHFIIGIIVLIIMGKVID